MRAKRSEDRGNLCFNYLKKINFNKKIVKWSSPFTELAHLLLLRYQL